MYRARTISLWQREEDGSYKAELEGFTIHVKWRPESREARRGFLWVAEGPEEARIEAADVVEEIEQAMGDAEYAVKKRVLSAHAPSAA